jgi:hypothetical protein
MIDAEVGPPPEADGHEAVDGLVCEVSPSVVEVEQLVADLGGGWIWFWVGSTWTSHMNLALRERKTTRVRGVTSPQRTGASTPGTESRRGEASLRWGGVVRRLTSRTVAYETGH